MCKRKPLVKSVSGGVRNTGFRYCLLPSIRAGGSISTVLASSAKNPAKS
ncbi:hypothetical protein AB1K84_13375 [Mesobacillus foraminis]